MDYFIVSLAAVVTAALTLFSGFGLGTLLMPIFALFFPVEMAVGATAVVHLANNLFKLALVGRNARKSMVIRFGIPAALAAIVGASLLGFAAHIPPLASYILGTRTHELTAIKLVIGCVIVLFAILELLPWFNRLSFPAKYTPLGGILSGFFGGLSGNQGALRSAFLLKANLTKEQFIGTGAVCAAIVDLSRLIVYGSQFAHGTQGLQSNTTRLVVVATIAAFLGSYVGSKMVKKLTLRALQIMVAILLMGLGAAMAAGLV